MRNIYIILTIGIILTSCFSCATQKPEKQDIIIQKEEPTQVEEVTVLPETTVDAVEESTNLLNESEIKEAETDIAALILQLNGIIASKDFLEWKTYLSDDYIRFYSDPKILKEKSESPLLLKYKIVLRTLEDYFNYVVVGSRQNVKLDEIKALDRDRIKAYMYINNNAVIIYELIRIDNNWKIGKFLE